MTIEQAKAIDLQSFLTELGCEPTHKGINTITYYSPIREEKSPSFVVYLNTNRWVDYGIPDGHGDILDLVCKVAHVNTTSQALEWLSKKSNLTSTIRQSIVKPHMNPVNTIVNYQLGPLRKRNLLQYMSTRGISNDVATKYCKEVWYNHGEKKYYGVAFPTCSKGIEVRNKYIKRSIGHKDISYIRVNGALTSRECCVFEGFMDFLSYIMLYKKQHPLAIIFPCDCLVLNSVSNVMKALPMVAVYSVIHCYLDNDVAGHSATQTITERYPLKTIDESCRYKAFNDVNDFLMDHLGLTKE